MSLGDMDITFQAQNFIKLQIKREYLHSRSISYMLVHCSHGFLGGKNTYLICRTLEGKDWFYPNMNTYIYLPYR